jgi:NADPH:quinone reductase-like Zn-dependent oxidoreductase
MATDYRAAFMTGPGKLLELTVTEIQRLAPGEVFIRNHTTALQPLDAKILIASCGPATLLNYPAVLGSSGAGIIEKVGDRVTGVNIGDRVVFDTKGTSRSMKIAEPVPGSSW